MRRSRRFTVSALAALGAVVLSGCASSDAGPPAFRSQYSTAPAPSPSAPSSSSPLAPASPTATGPGEESEGGTPVTTSVPTAPTTPIRANAPWSLDFDGDTGLSQAASLFQYRTGGHGWGNQELETYTERSENATLQDGNLAIRAVREHYTGADGFTRDWTSARLDSYGKFAFTTGTLSVRLKTPIGDGMWPAFWLLGTDLPTVSWPNSGEIDIMESLGGQHLVYHSIHGPNGKANGYTHGKKLAAPTDEYHVYSVTRSPGRIVMSIDGAVTATFTRAVLKAGEAWVFDKPMFLTINLAVGGWPGPPDSSTPSPSTLLIDWIRFTP